MSLAIGVLLSMKLFEEELYIVKKAYRLAMHTWCMHLRDFVLSYIVCVCATYRVDQLHDYVVMQVDICWQAGL